MSVSHDNEDSIREVGNNGSRIDELFHLLNQKAASLGCGISPDVILAETIGDMAPGLQLRSGPDGTSIIPGSNISIVQIESSGENTQPALESKQFGISQTGGNVFDIKKPQVPQE